MSFIFNNKDYTHFPDGVYSVLITPFTEDNQINYSEIGSWVTEQLESNVVGIVLHGTTSENPTVSYSEKMRITEYVINVYNVYYTIRPNNVSKLICIGVGTNNTADSIEFAIKCKPFCHAMMVVMPYYNKPPQRALVEHFRAICNNPELQDTMFLLYNVPSRTGVHCLPETVKKIFEACPNAKAIKEASGNPTNTEEIVNLCKNMDIKVFSGDDKIVLDILKKGAKGLISVASNVFPNYFAKLVSTYFENPDLAQQLYSDFKTDELCDAMFIETNPIAVKRMMVLSGKYSNDYMRLPLVELDPKYDNIVKNAFDNFNNKFKNLFY